MVYILRNIDFHLSYGPGDDRLNAFYIPALRASAAYDRMTGYFTSSSLAIAAAGVAHLVAGGGQMRLLVGAQLDPRDVEAIRQGHDLREVIAERLAAELPDPNELTDRLLRDRMGVLAWLVASGALELRVVLPKGPDGLPLPAPEAHDYFHPKVGVFTDAAGDQIAFSGSINESETGWIHNYEQFFVFRSWTEEGRLYVAEAIRRFARLWEGREPDWICLPVPEAARQRLLRYCPARPPARDPLEPGAEPLHEEAPGLPASEAAEQERLLCRFLRDAPHLVGAAGLGAATCAVAPWVHQTAVCKRAVAGYPPRLLLADEVGLGKTIEAGLVVRQLYLSGIARRILILAPRSVLRQWQEELYEKFSLDVPRYDGERFIDVSGHEVALAAPAQDANPWDRVQVVLASSQLMKRRERAQILLAARPWDLVLVDEAHHARRKDFLNLNIYRPNRLLELLNALQDRTAGLILMTATPMQVHPVEVWDLLTLLGLGDAWGGDARAFLRFYDELRKPLDDADLAFVYDMVRAELPFQAGTASGANGLDPQFVALTRRELGPVDWERVRGVLTAHDPARAIRELPAPARRVAIGLAQHHTPLRRLVSRHTRRLMHEYQRQGLLRANVPQRSPRLEWIAMRPEERLLYDRIEEYISSFYRKYEAERKGLGFVMTVYRRRLTSSFSAVRCSLKRRLDFLRGRVAGLGAGEWPQAGLDEDDLEQDDLNLDIGEDLAQADPALFRDEIAYVEDFLHALRMLGEHDSKTARLLADLPQIFRTRDTVLIFTQYTDTMDYLRDQLARVYGRQVACYSGRGGERWDGALWIPVSKEEIKNDFRSGEQVKILLCTEAASEGLNLQTCGVLINYDMPWNPMRVEQRIGRIDRIGQRYPDVWIRNYFYEDTVEARVYRALEGRIRWFQDVVGPLQPILAQVGQTIQALAMVPEAERQQALQAEIARIETALDNARAGFDLDALAGPAQDTAAAAAPMTLAELGQAVVACPSLSGLLRPHETIPEAFWLTLNAGPVAVTFDAACFDAHPNSVQLLTYGNPLLDELMARVPTPAEASGSPILRLAVDAPLPRVAYYIRDANAAVRRVDHLAALRKILKESQAGAAWSDADLRAAQADFDRAVEAEAHSIEAHRAQRTAQRASALAAQARRLLLDAALIELALGQAPGLFGQSEYPAVFGEQAIQGLRRHRYPWAPLLKLTDTAGLRPNPTDPYYLGIQNQPAENLKRQFVALSEKASRLLKELSTVRM